MQTKVFFYHEYFDSYIQNHDKNAKNSQLCQFQAQIFFPDMRFVAVNSKYSLVLHIFELGIFNRAPRHHTKYLKTPHSGPIGCQPAPHIFPLAKEDFAKEKMFWNNHRTEKNRLYLVQQIQGNIIFHVFLWISWTPFIEKSAVIHISLLFETLF